MEQLKIILTAACMLSIAIGICNVLKPSPAFERQVRFLISLLFVIGLTAPLLQIDWTISPEVLAGEMQTAHTEALTKELQAQLLEKTQLHTETALREMLAGAGISCTELDVSVHIDEEQCIYISEVSAVCSDVQNARDILHASLGEEVTVHVKEMAS